MGKERDLAGQCRWFLKGVAALMMLVPVAQVSCHGPGGDLNRPLPAAAVQTDKTSGTRCLFIGPDCPGKWTGLPIMRFSQPRTISFPKVLKRILKHNCSKSPGITLAGSFQTATSPPATLPGWAPVPIGHGPAGIRTPIQPPGAPIPAPS